MSGASEIRPYVARIQTLVDRNRHRCVVNVPEIRIASFVGRPGLLAVSDIKRWWLHQANINMNELIARRLLGRNPNPGEAPVVLDQYANTASAGSLIAFKLHHEDLGAGDLGVICSFGAGYSIGSLVLRKL